MNRGIYLALSAYIFWDLHPIYWKQLLNVPAFEIVSHRILWSLLFFSIVITFRKEWKGLIQKIKEDERRWILFIPSLLIGSNWALYIWAVNTGYIIETSLGYFISPLLYISLGVFFLKENLRKTQWFAVTIACIGVLIMTIFYGQFPWIALALACTWSFYGLLRKIAPLNSIEGLTLDTALLVIPVLFYFVFLTANSAG